MDCYDFQVEGSPYTLDLNGEPGKPDALHNGYRYTFTEFHDESTVIYSCVEKNAFEKCTGKLLLHLDHGLAIMIAPHFHDVGLPEKRASEPLQKKLKIGKSAASESEQSTSSSARENTRPVKSRPIRLSHHSLPSSTLRASHSISDDGKIVTKISTVEMNRLNPKKKRPTTRSTSKAAFLSLEASKERSDYGSLESSKDAKISGTKTKRPMTAVKRKKCERVTSAPIIASQADSDDSRHSEEIPMTTTSQSSNQRFDFVNLLSPKSSTPSDHSEYIPSETSSLVTSKRPRLRSDRTLVTDKTAETKVLTRKRKRQPPKGSLPQMSSRLENEHSDISVQQSLTPTLSNIEPRPVEEELPSPQEGSSNTDDSVNLVQTESRVENTTSHLTDRLTASCAEESSVSNGGPPRPDLKDHLDAIYNDLKSAYTKLHRYRCKCQEKQTLDDFTKKVQDLIRESQKKSNWLDYDSDDGVPSVVFSDIEFETEVMSTDEVDIERARKFHEEAVWERDQQIRNHGWYKGQNSAPRAK